MTGRTVQTKGVVMNKRRRWIGVLGLLLIPWGLQAADLGPLSIPWGLNLEELTRVFEEKIDPRLTLREDSSVYEIELQIRPAKSVKIPRGGLSFVEAVSREARQTAVGRIFGYLWEGKYFGRVFLYSHHPGLSRTQVTLQLKNQFPEGRLFHRFQDGLMVSDFELDSGTLLIFTNERGVYLYEPGTLKKVLREAERERQEQSEREELRKFREEGNKPL